MLSCGRALQWKAEINLYTAEEEGIKEEILLERCYFFE